MRFFLLEVTMSALLNRHKETFYIQKHVEADNGWGSDWGTQKELQDGEPIQGLFIPAQSDEILVASAPTVRTRGRFIADIDAPIDDRDILRNEKHGYLLSLTGDPLAVDGFTLKGKQFTAEVTDRPLEIIAENNPQETPAEPGLPGSGWEGW
jgi:hypothetical protein